MRRHMTGRIDSMAKKATTVKRTYNQLRFFIRGEGASGAAPYMSIIGEFLLSIRPLARGEPTGSNVYADISCLTLPVATSLLIGPIQTGLDLSQHPLAAGLTGNPETVPTVSANLSILKSQGKARPRPADWGPEALPYLFPHRHELWQAALIQ